MQSLTFLLLAVFAGMLIPMQNSLNAQLGRFAGHPLTTVLLVFASGVVCCGIALLFFRPALPTALALRSAPAGAWLGGLIAMAYVVIVISAMPRLGAGLTTTAILVGQMVIALLLDHFGLLGNAPHPMNAPRVAGLALMLGGMLLIKQF